MDINLLLQQAAQIRDEQTPRANSANRIGTLFYSLLETLQLDTTQAGPFITTTEGEIIPAPFITTINADETLMVPERVNYSLRELNLAGNLELLGTINL